MRRISELTPEEAMDLWFENGEELTALFNNEKVKNAMKEGNNQEAFKLLVKECQPEVSKILLWLDPTPITPFNLFPRVATLISDMGSEEQTNFFTSTQQTEASSASTAATVRTQDDH